MPFANAVGAEALKARGEDKASSAGYSEKAYLAPTMGT
jgi:hypothetical protein